MGHNLGIARDEWTLAAHLLHVKIGKECAITAKCKFTGCWKVKNELLWNVGL